MFDKILLLHEKLEALKFGDGKLVEALTKLVHSPLVALAVRVSPNKADDAILEVLKTLFPEK